VVEDEDKLWDNSGASFSITKQYSSLLALGPLSWLENQRLEKEKIN
jgi:hypothetical protein